MNSLLIGISLIIILWLGQKKDLNVGILAIPFAYIIGTFFLHMKPEAVISGWPIEIFFVILGITLFFGFVSSNGTLNILANNILYHFRKVPLILPVGIFFISALLAALGAGYFAVMVLMGPIALLVCKKSDISPLIGALAADTGGQVGSNFMVGLNGAIYRKLISGENHSSIFAFKSSVSIFLVYLIMTLLEILVLMFFSNYKRKKDAKAGKVTKNKLEFKKPEKFNHQQKINLILIALFIVILLVPPIAHLIFPNISWIDFVDQSIDVGLVSVIFAVIAFLINLGKKESVMSKIPWNTLLMISGMGMLVEVAIKAGTINLLTNWIKQVPVILIPVVICLVAALFNIFGGSFVGVVAPALFPLVATLANATTLSPMMLYTAVCLGGLATGISPFSAGGAMILGFTPKKERNDMYKKEFFIGLPFCIGFAVIFSIIYFAIAG